MSDILDWIIPKQDKWWAWYSAYLKSDRWREKRERCLERAGRRCQVKVKGKRCTAKAVHAHHLTYKRVGRERQSDLLAVCLKHHEQIHGRKLTT